MSGFLSIIPILVLLSPLPLYVSFHLLYMQLIPYCQVLQGDFTTWSPCSISCMSSRFVFLRSLLFSFLASLISTLKSFIDVEIIFFSFSILLFISAENTLFETLLIAPVIKNVINAESVYLNSLHLFANAHKPFLIPFKLFVISNLSFL